jgi:uroporphyrinogen-III synthase
MSATPHIVSTRMLTSERLIDLQTKGWKFTQHDFISKVIHVPDTLTADQIHKHVVLTSITGVKSFLQIAAQLHLNSLDFVIYCISRGTKEYAAANGLTIKSTGINAAALADEILKDAEVKAVTYVSSNLRRNELTDKLSKAGVKVHEVTAYRTDFTPLLVNASYDALVFFSPSAVDSFLSCNSLQQVPCFCIGKTTGDYARLKGYHTMYTAEAPSEDFLLQTIINFYSKSPAHVKE